MRTPFFNFFIVKYRSEELPLTRIFNNDFLTDE